MNLLLVVDMQNDFIDGALGTAEAVAVVPCVTSKMRTFDGPILCTRDTHTADYLQTQEGRRLPVVHCVQGTKGWQLNSDVEALRTLPALDKPTFGSLHLEEEIKIIAKGQVVDTITVVGLCTDICVISNAIILKAAFPETEIIVDAACCAGVTPQSHATALEAMKMCQITVLK